MYYILSSCPSGFLRHRASMKGFCDGVVKEPPQDGRTQCQILERDSRPNSKKRRQRTTKNGPKIDQKSTKIGPKSVLEALLAHPGAIFPPREPKSAKNAQNGVRGPPPRIQAGSQNPCKIDPEAFQMQFFFVSFFGSRSNTSVGRFASDPGPKMKQKSSQNRCPKRSCRKCKIFKKPQVFISFLRIRGVGNRVKIVFEPTSEKDAQPHPKNVTQNGQLSPKTIQVEGQVGPKIAARGYPRAS